MFYEKRSKDSALKEISWNGVGRNKKPLHVGFDYTYALLFVDEAGNSQRLSGNPFKLYAFRYKKSGKTVVSLYPEALFSDRSSLKFTKRGKNRLYDVKDQLRTIYRKKVDVIVYDDDVKFGLARSKKIRDFFMESLDWPEDKLNVMSKPIQKGNGYRHVEIITK